MADIRTDKSKKQVALIKEYREITVYLEEINQKLCWLKDNLWMVKAMVLEEQYCLTALIMKANGKRVKNMGLESIHGIMDKYT